MAQIETASRARTADGLSLRDRLAQIDQGILIALVTLVMVAIGAVLVDGFLTGDNLMTILRASSALGILAVGSAIVIMAKGVDLSVVVVTALTAQGAVHLWTRNDFSELQALVVMGMVAITIGVINGWMVAYVGIPALFTTLGMWLLVDGAARVWLLDNQVYILPADSNVVTDLGRGELFGIPFPIVAATVAFLAGWLFLEYTSQGRLIRAYGDNPEAARLAGIPTRPLVVLTFVICAGSAAVAGVLLLGINGSYSTAYGGGKDLLFNAITAAVIGGVSLTGGKGSIFGVLWGTLFIGTFVNLMTLLNLSVEVSSLLKAAVLVVALAFDSWLHPRDEETAKSDDL
ncbi:ABC transporter permease [Nocardioides sp. YIM 152315]|uniref:ABC transporter permease n=1 Tax=Nocardioides sp. YIM 152315 TaxID=3031760 RepID=UPI0023D9BCF5|nr:ABC transporter permease [Nocardioides sp. YIM 152315]MDF1602210.1 ABC transporter permease [Nocardioides sp. YIM 152315]